MRYTKKNVSAAYEDDEDNGPRFAEKLAVASKARAAANPWSGVNAAKRAEKNRSRYRPFTKRRRATASG